MKSEEKHLKPRKEGHGKVFVFSIKERENRETHNKKTSKKWLGKVESMSVYEPEKPKKQFRKRSHWGSFDGLSPMCIFASELMPSLPI